MLNCLESTFLDSKYQIDSIDGITTMIGSWQPNSTQQVTINSDKLTELLAILAPNSNGFSNVDLQSNIPEVLLNEAACWITQGYDSWQNAVNTLDHNQIWLLAKFYALAEEQLDAFSAQENNPAIVLFKILKKQGATLTKEDTQALKSLSSNRYIPFGKVLL